MVSSCNRFMKIWKLFFVLTLIFSYPSTLEANFWNWLPLGPAAVHSEPPLRDRQRTGSRPTDLAKFDIESGVFLSSSRGKDLVEKARHQTAKHSCWHNAYSDLLSSCREILKEEEKKARLAMRLTNCFLKVSERDAIHCPDSIPISKCTSGLSDHINSIFLAFFIDAASMCHHLQSEAFKQETEHVINELKGSAHWVEDQLKTMESQTSTIAKQNEDVIAEQKLLQTKMQEHSNQLVQEYHRLHAELRERVKDGFSDLSFATKEVHAQLQGVGSLQKEMTVHQKEILDQQKDMSDHQRTLANSLSVEFATLHKKTHEISASMSEEFSSLHQKTHVISDSLGSLQEKSHVIADSLVREFSSLHEESQKITESLTAEFSSLHERSHQLAESLTAEFSSLHDVTHEIDNGVQRSLTGQKALLDGQVQAELGLNNLKELQENALEESRAAVLALTREAKMHQQEFLAWQTKLQMMHEQLTSGSNAMLEAQESFVSKQTAVFASLERLFSLHNAILLESRALKTFLFYFATSIFVYMSTSTKQTCSARPLLYCGLVLTFAVELWILRCQTTATRGLQQILSSLIFPRWTYGIITVALLMYSIFTYRDYSTMSYEILLDLQERLKGLPSTSPAAYEEIYHQTATPVSKISRCNDSYERMLAKKIVRRARACRSNPITWFSSAVCKQEPIPTSLDSSLDAQTQRLDDGCEDPDYKPSLDLDAIPLDLDTIPLDSDTPPLASPTHSYNLRPRRRSRLGSETVSSLRFESADSYTKSTPKF